MSQEWRCSGCNQWGGRFHGQPDSRKCVSTVPACPGCEERLGALESQGGVSRCAHCKIQLTAEEAAAWRAPRPWKCACGGTWEWVEKRNAQPKPGVV